LAFLLFHSEIRYHNNYLQSQTSLPTHKVEKNEDIAQTSIGTQKNLAYEVS